MAKSVIEKLSIEPYFDLELFMTTSQETRIGAEVMEKITNAWERWISHIQAYKIIDDNKTYLLVELDENIEAEIDSLWEDSASEAFLYNALAQVMCMGMIHAVLPQVEEAGCAPAPKYSETLSEALMEIGTPYTTAGEPGLSKRYAVLTYLPFKGGCEVCSLRQNCPKANNQCATGPTSVELPGY